MRTISIKRWTKEFDRAAKKQGWTLFDADGVMVIQKIDDPEPGDASLSSDQEAWDVAFTQAMQGDEGAILALYLSGREVWVSHEQLSKFYRPEVKR